MPLPLHKEAERQPHEAVRALIEDAVRERFGNAVTAVRTEIVENHFGEIQLIVTIEVEVDTPRSRLRNSFFGLTSHVRRAMGNELKDVFPVIVPVAAPAHA